MVPDTSSASASGDRVASIGWGDREPWEAELRLLFTSPRGNSAWEKCSALLAMVPREIGAKGGVPEFQLKEMFRRALDYADSHELERALPADYEAARTRRAFRHGVRGTFQLVRPDRSAANPLTEREQRLAFVGLRQSLANVRRLAGLWWADEMDKPGQRTARTLAVWGSSRDQLDAFCEQLVDDLRHYIQPSPDPVGRAEGPDESSEFREYASALASALDIASPGYPRPLTPTALAPLLTLSRLRSSEPQSSASDRSLYAARGTRGGEAVRTSLRSVDRAIVLGDPGGGKSTVLADVLIDSVRGRREPAVVWCRLADLASQLTTLRELPDSVAEILELLADAGRVSLGILVRPDVDALVKALRGPDGGVIALDGLDEVPEDKRSMVEAIIRRIDVVGAKIIVTSRHTGYRPFVQGWTEFCVDQLEPDAADRFIGAWFSDVADVEPARRARAAIAESGDASIGKVPVLLGIVARVASSGDVPTNIGELYGRYLDLFLAQEWRGGAGSADAGSMHRRLDVMQRLAWSMALSGSDNVTGASWSDVMTLSELYESAGVGDQMALVDIIVSRDGALVPHGPHAYRGAQSFRWIHRSVHEYLVGAHLAGLLRRDRPRWQSHFEAILQGSLAWVEPTRFMVALLSTRPDALDAVFDFGHRFRHLGDPGHVILDRLRSMSEILPPDSRHRAKIARAYVQLGNYSSAQMTHEPTWRTAYLAALRSQDETEVLNALRQAGPVLNGPERAQEVEVLDAIEHSSERIALTRSGAACYAIEAFGKHRPDTQLLLYAKLLMLGMPRLLPPDYEYEKYTSSAVGAALRIVAAGSDDVRRSLLHHVLFTGSPLPTGVDAPAWVDEAPAYQAFTACGEYGQVSAERFTDLRETAVLAGHLGDHFAYQYGRMGRDGSYEASRNGEIAPCAWANVGVWLSDLFADPYQPRSSRKVPWLRVDGSVEDSAFVAVDLADPEHILVLVRLLLRWSLDPSGAQLTQLVQLYRRLLGTVSDLDAHGLARQPHGYATTLLVSCVEQVLGRHGARAAREILSTDSEDWEGVPGEPLLRALAASGLDSEGLVDLVVWGLLGGMDILGEWSYPTGSAAEWLSLADERGIRPADLPFRGRQQLASWLARDGQLPRWRNEFLRIAQNGEPTGLQVQ